MFHRLMFGLGFGLFSQFAMALDYVSVTGDNVPFYDAPSTQAKKLGTISGSMPVEVLINLNGWLKVRTPSRTLCWLETGNTSPRRTVLVSKSLVDVYELPQFTSRVLFRVEQEVTLDWLDNTGDGWVKVRHQDGETGYVRSEQVWGE